MGPLQNRSSSQPAPVYTPGRGACLTEGCQCKDARVLNYRHLRFIKALALTRGQTVDRAVPAGDLSGVLLCPNESENVESEETGVSAPPTCECFKCECSNVRTIAHPTRCEQCQKGWHR